MEGTRSGPPHAFQQHTAGCTHHLPAETPKAPAWPAHSTSSASLRLRGSALDPLRLCPGSTAPVQLRPIDRGGSTVALSFFWVCLTVSKQLHPVPASVSKISLKSVLDRTELYWSLPFPLLAYSDCGSRLESSLGFFRKKKKVLMTNKTKILFYLNLAWRTSEFIRIIFWDKGLG